MSEIQALEERVRALGQSADWWNDKMVWGLVFAALAAIFVVATTVMALRRSGQKDDAQSNLIRAKDRQLALDLREKDTKIAEANERTAREALARSTLEIEFIKQEPRITLLRWHRNDLIKNLSPFSGQRFTTLNCFANIDTEAIRTSSEITVILESEAGWINNFPHGSFGGLNISDVGIVVRILPAASERTRRAATELFSALRDVLITGVQFADNGQQVKAILPATIPFDESTVLIEVGEHPYPLSPPHSSDKSTKSNK
jgi:hypothetical protein